MHTKTQHTKGIIKKIKKKTKKKEEKQKTIFQNKWKKKRMQKGKQTQIK